MQSHGSLYTNLILMIFHTSKNNDLKISHEVFFSPFSTSWSAGLASMHNYILF